MYNACTTFEASKIYIRDLEMFSSPVNFTSYNYSEPPLLIDVVPFHLLNNCFFCLKFMFIISHLFSFLLFKISSSSQSASFSCHSFNHWFIYWFIYLFIHPWCVSFLSFLLICVIWCSCAHSLLSQVGLHVLVAPVSYAPLVDEVG